MDGRSDIYSLGVVLYQMLTGDLPLWADSELKLLMAQVTAEPVPIQQRVPDIPPLVAYLVMRSLAKDPANRPQDAAAFVKEIEEIEDSLRPRPAPPIPVVPKAPSIPTLPRYTVDYATASQQSTTPFFTKTKVFAVLAMLLAAMSLGAFGVWAHFRSLRTAAAAAAPPTISQTATPRTTAANTPPETLGVTTPVDNPKPDAEDNDPEDTAEQSAITPAPVPTRSPAISKPVKPRAAAQVPDPSEAAAFEPKQAPLPQQEEPAKPSAAATPGKDPWAAYTGDQPASGNSNAPQTSGTFPDPKPNAPQMGNSYPNEMPNQRGYPRNQSILMPSVTAKVEPKYTNEARSFRYSGITVLSVVIDERGFPSDIRVMRQAGYGLDRRAMEAVSHWRFSPAIRNGSPMMTRVKVQTTFHFAGFLSYARSSIIP